MPKAKASPDHFVPSGLDRSHGRPGPKMPAAINCKSASLTVLSPCPLKASKWSKTVQLTSAGASGWRSVLYQYNPASSSEFQPYPCGASLRFKVASFGGCSQDKCGSLE